MNERGSASPLQLKEGLLVLGQGACANEAAGDTASSPQDHGEEPLLGYRFENAEHKVDPYRFVTALCSETERLRELRAHLAAAPFQQKRSDGFFCHSEMRLYPHNSEGFGWLLSDPCLRSVQRFVEDCFGVPLAADMEVVAQRMDAGDYSGFHNDSPRFGWETHRLNLYLNDDWNVARGGRLQIASTLLGEPVSDFIEPKLGHVMTFEACSNSYHAIEPVREGERYSILYMFWHAANAPGVARSIDLLIRQSRMAWDRYLAERHRALIELLAVSGAGEMPHGTSNLMDHLLDACCLLLAWGLPEHVGLAALLQGFDEENLTADTFSSLGLDRALHARAVMLLSDQNTNERGRGHEKHEKEVEGERAVLKLANMVAVAPHVTFSHARWAARKQEWNGGDNLQYEPARRAARLLFDHGARDGGPIRDSGIKSLMA